MQHSTNSAAVLTNSDLHIFLMTHHKVQEQREAKATTPDDCFHMQTGRSMAGGTGLVHYMCHWMLALCLETPAAGWPHNLHVSQRLAESVCVSGLRHSVQHGFCIADGCCSWQCARCMCRARLLQNIGRRVCNTAGGGCLRGSAAVCWHLPSPEGARHTCLLYNQPQPAACTV